MGFADAVARMDQALPAHVGGEAVVYAPAGGGAPVTVQGIFEADHALILDGAVETVGPAVFLRIADLPADPDTDNPRLTIRGQVYVPHRRERDTMGGILLMLHKAA